MVDFDVGREPLAGEAGVDRVVAEAADDGVDALTVAGVEAVAGRDAPNGTVLRDRDRPAEVLHAPAEPDHVVVRGPLGKGVVASVPDIDAAAVAHEGLELVAHGSRPGGAAAEVALQVWMMAA